MIKFKNILIIFVFCLIAYANITLIGENIISKTNDDIIKLHLNVSFFTAFISPFISIFFLFISAKFMLFYYDVKIKGILLLDIITDSLLPTLLIGFFTFLIIYFNHNKINSIETFEEIENITIIYNFTLIKILNLYNFSWIIYFPLMIYFLLKKIDLSLKKSIIIVTFPTILFLIFNYFLQNVEFF
jgi:hypothetical protein